MLLYIIHTIIVYTRTQLLYKKKKERDWLFFSLSRLIQVVLLRGGGGGRQNCPIPPPPVIDWRATLLPIPSWQRTGSSCAPVCRSHYLFPRHGVQPVYCHVGFRLVPFCPALGCVVAVFSQLRIFLTRCACCKGYFYRIHSKTWKKHRNAGRWPTKRTRDEHCFKSPR